VLIRASRLRQYGDPVEGEALAPVVYIRVQWAWLSFLASQIFLSILFLIAVIVQTAGLGVEVVKSCEIASLFAVDYRSLPTPSRSDTSTGLVSPGLRRELDTSVRGKLHGDHTGWRVQLDGTGLQRDGLEDVSFDAASRERTSSTV
jgi:hypothetical protein